MLHICTLCRTLSNNAILNLIFYETVSKMQGSDDEEDAKEAAAANHNLIYKSSEVCEARGSTGRREEVRGGEGRQVQLYQKETGMENNTTFT